MSVMPIPRRWFRFPEDARPRGKEHTIYIETGRDGWGISENNEGGGAILGVGLTNVQAISIGVEWVRRHNAELHLTNGGEE
jgi:hypothetical protein